MKKKKVGYYAYIEGDTRGLEINPNPSALCEKKETENLSDIAFCDCFICKNCGIKLKDWVRVNTEPDWDGYIDEAYYEYEFKFCPNCGAKVMDGEPDEP